MKKVLKQKFKSKVIEFFFEVFRDKIFEKKNFHEKSNKNFRPKSYSRRFGEKYLKKKY
jgi:hypothetical protein